ncbi:hypothetical protein PAMC26577_11040 [Caballeronia sordidicola]|uniref:Uncharacterized protein n=1 Tax=Caballeronia sordidicola TaxID=196367 RepID=A0A242MYB0_CABSO|nr:hypothetical protein PAMC26577_11040 [Caballeronia sordidicola]
MSPDSRFWHHPGVSVLPRISPPTGFDIAATSRGHRAVRRNEKVLRSVDTARASSKETA